MKAKLIKVLDLYCKVKGLRKSQKGDVLTIFVNDDDGFIFTDLRLILESFFGFYDMMDFENGYVKIQIDNYPYLDEIDEQELSEALPSYKDVLE